MLATKEQARKLRRNATLEEKALWERLRDRNLQSLKFRRQVPIGPFIPDFCCPERRVVIELDGEGHREAQQAAYDSERDAYLRGLDYIVLRFPNQRILEDLDSVLQDIASAIVKSPPSWLRSKKS